MRLYVNEKIISIHNRYFIKVVSGKDIHEISNNIMPLEFKTSINDMNGKELAYIKREFHLMPKYNVFINNKLEYSINKEFQLLKSNYKLSNNYRVEGQFLSHNFIIYNDKNEKVGEIFREYFTIGDRYIIDIIDENDYLLILTIIVAITRDIDRAQASASHSHK
jgi:uncharacterized protein YxjI